MAIRTYKVTLDTKNTIAPEPIYFRQGDKTGAVTIDASVTDNGIPVSLDGLTPTFRSNTADGKALIVDGNNFTITDAANGRFTYRVPNALGAEPGKVKSAYFTFSDTDGVESTFGLVFIIQPSIDMTQEQAKDYITIVDGIFKDYKSKVSSTYNDYKSQTDSVLKSFQDQVNSTFNNFQNQVKTSTDSMNNTLKQLSDKTDGLNTSIQQALTNFNQGDFYNKTQTDSKDAATLTSAKSYTDNQISALPPSTPWQPLTIISPFTQGERHPYVRRIGSKVYFTGSIGKAGQNGDIFNIPVGFRPSIDIHVDLPQQSGDIDYRSRIYIVNGMASVVAFNGTSPIWIDPISYYTDDPMPS